MPAGTRTRPGASPTQAHTSTLSRRRPWQPTRPARRRRQPRVPSPRSSPAACAQPPVAGRTHRHRFRRHPQVPDGPECQFCVASAINLNDRWADQIGRECARLRSPGPITLREARFADLQIPIADSACPAAVGLELCRECIFAGYGCSRRYSFACQLAVARLSATSFAVRGHGRLAVRCAPRPARRMLRRRPWPPGGGRTRARARAAAQCRRPGACHPSASA